MYRMQNDQEMTFVIDGEVIRFRRGLLPAGTVDASKLAKIPSHYPVLDDDDRVVNPPLAEVAENTPNFDRKGTSKRSKTLSNERVPETEEDPK